MWPEWVSHRMPFSKAPSYFSITESGTFQNELDSGGTNLVERQLPEELGYGSL